MENVYDVIILGAGPAGSTAALYLSRYARSVCVIGKDLGLSGVAGEIENWPGTESISGQELTTKIQEHAKKYGATFLYEDILKVGKEEHLFFVEAANKKMKSKTLILANGSEHKKLDVKGEDEFIGRGVSYCATCDGMFFRNKKVAVVGGSDAAAKAVLFLSDIAEEVNLIYRRDKMRCEPVYLERMKNKSNLNFYYNNNISEIRGNENVEEIILENDEVIKVNGVFVEIGSSPCSQFSQPLGIKCDERGYILVDKSMKTNMRGVFAAGDITNTPLRQLITASADGAIAANSAHEFLQRN